MEIIIHVIMLAISLVIAFGYGYERGYNVANGEILIELYKDLKGL